MDTKLIRVGSSAPDFTLYSANGEEVQLSSFHNHKNVVLYFMREFT